MMYRLSLRKMTLLLTGSLFLSTLLLAGCEGGETIRSTRFGEPEISGSFLFPTTPPGQTAESRMMIRNVGDGELQLAGFQADLGPEYRLEWSRGTLPGDARILGYDGEINSFPDSLTLQPDEVISLVMTYAPQSDHAPSGQLLISTNSASDHLRELLLPVRGLSRNGELVVTPNVIDMGRVVIGDRAETTVRASNWSSSANITRLVVWPDRFRFGWTHDPLLSRHAAGPDDGGRSSRWRRLRNRHPEAELARLDHGVLMIAMML